MLRVRAQLPARVAMQVHRSNGPLSLTLTDIVDSDVESTMNTMSMLGSTACSYVTVIVNESSYHMLYLARTGQLVYFKLM